jgi:hypothetical protein
MLGRATIAGASEVSAVKIRAGIVSLALLSPAFVNAEELINGWPMPGPSLAGESEGPFQRLVIEGGMLIDGTGSPPIGPVTVIVEGDRITQILGLPGLYTPQVGPSGRVEIRPGDKHIDARGSYILPGLIDTMTRILDRSPFPNSGNTSRLDNPPPEYTLKLQIAHGITTTTSMQSTYQFDWVNALKKASAENRITAPHVLAWMDFPAATPEEARAKVRDAKKRGADGFGEGDMEGPPQAMLAGLDEARKLGVPTIFCMHANTTERLHVLDFARAGLGSLPHAWGLPDAFLDKQTIRSYPADYNYNDGRKMMRGGRGWQDAAPPYSEKWNKAMDELLSLDFTLTPTFVVFEVHRDLMGVSRAEWMREYAHPALVSGWLPGKGGPDDHFSDWSTADEINWRRDFQLWMTFVNEYKNRGGRVVAGSDANYLWTLAGFGLVRNLELLQEAGFSPLEAIRAATYDSAVWLKVADRTGSVEVGKRADLLVVEGNPLANFKLLYGTGTVGKRPDGSTGRIGGVKYTVKGGVVFDSKAVLANVKQIVQDAKKAASFDDSAL